MLSMETLLYRNPFFTPPHRNRNDIQWGANHMTSQYKQQEYLLEGIHKNRSISSKIPEVLMKGHLKRSGPMTAIAIDRITTTLL